MWLVSFRIRLLSELRLTHRLDEQMVTVSSVFNQDKQQQWEALCVHVGFGAGGQEYYLFRLTLKTGVIEKHGVISNHVLYPL